MRIERNDLIFQPSEGVQCHASHLTPLADGGVLAVWFQGSREGANDVCIWGARFSPDGKWSETRRISPEDGLPHWNPVLFRRADGEILLFYKRGRTIAYWQTMVMKSADEGKSWTEPRELVPGDEGETWTRTADIRLPEPAGERPNPYGAIQPSLWEDEAGVHALLRTSQGYLYRTDSEDLGRSWSQPASSGIPNNNSGIDLVKAPDGTLYLACNPVGENWGARSPISLLISKDGGAHWEHLTHLVTMPGEYSYPAVLWQDGCLLITHTWQRKSIQFWKIRL